MEVSSIMGRINKEKKREYDKEYRLKNKEKIKEGGKQYYLKNKERITIRVAKWQEENKEARKEYLRQYYLINKEIIKKAANKNRLARPVIDRWAAQTIRTHRTSGCVVNFSKERLIEIATKNDCCQLCGIKLNFFKSDHSHHVDDVTLDRMNNEKILNENNVLILCWLCNMTKGIRTMEQFYNYCKMIAKKDFSVYEKS